jgi:hypothetical protein
MMVLQALIIPYGGSEMFYDYDNINAYCYYAINGHFAKIDQLLFSMSLGIPPFATFISFAISVYKLSKKNSMSHTMSKRKQQASVTIASFTALFLICNAPCFINNLVYTIGYFMNIEYPRPFYMSTFMFFYSWVLAEVVSMVVNAALNPVLYYLRVQGLKVWTLSLFQGKNKQPHRRVDPLSGGVKSR